MPVKFWKNKIFDFSRVLRRPRVRAHAHARVVNVTIGFPTPKIGGVGKWQHLWRNSHNVNSGLSFIKKLKKFLKSDTCARARACAWDKTNTIAFPTPDLGGRQNDRILGLHTSEIKLGSFSPENLKKLRLAMRARACAHFCAWWHLSQWILHPLLGGDRPNDRIYGLCSTKLHLSTCFSKNLENNV